MYRRAGRSVTMPPGTEFGQMLLATPSGGDVVKGLHPPIPLFFSFFTTKVNLFVFLFSFSFCNIMQMFGVSRSMWIMLLYKMSFDYFLWAVCPQGCP
ncbi:hypothetical protein HDV62DRAFT_234639 [Trichoderma sp. SZMC 28011]